MKIYIWGTGCGAAEAIQRGIELSKIEAFVDSRPLKDSFMGLPVISPQELAEKKPSLVIVSARHTDEISKTCRELNIPESRILYMKDYSILENRNRNCSAAGEILGPELLNRLIPKQHIVSSPVSLLNPRLKSSSDYIRISTLELISRKISDIPGAMAELGVYKGEFSSCMNELMPDRKLYLFDTFEGFDRKEGIGEMTRNTCGEPFLQAHQNTSLNFVMEKMPYPQNVIIKAGLFPKSLMGLEESFSLVSLDADFRESTLEGLRYFWPRLNEGGYIMLHDWGSPKLRGVAEALELYERELGSKIPAVPIPDIGSSLILTKNEQ